MQDDIPEEDKVLESCTHKYVLVQQASGFARISPDKYILFFYCENCLYTRHRIVDVSDQHVDPGLIEEYKQQNSESDDSVGV